MRKEKIEMRKVWRKPDQFCGGTRRKPLLLFVSYGIDETETEPMKRYFVIINGIDNPLPFKRAYGINQMHLEAWLKSNGWELAGQEFCS